MTLGFYYDPKDRKFHVYKDNVKVGSAVNTNAPDDEELAVTFAIQNAAAAAKIMTMDYISAGKERTANTELYQINSERLVMQALVKRRTKTWQTQY